MKKLYITPLTTLFAVSPLQMIADSLGDTDIPVGGGGAEVFDAKGGVSWEFDDDDDNLPSVHFGR